VVTQQVTIRTVQSLAKQIMDSGIHLKRVYLYGSFARNQQHENSDIDVALVADEFTGVGFDDIRLFVRYLRKYTMIQARTYSTEYFEQGDPFIDEIKETGIEINF